MHTAGLLAFASASEIPRYVSWFGQLQGPRKPTVAHGLADFTTPVCTGSTRTGRHIPCVCYILCFQMLVSCHVSNDMLPHLQTIHSHPHRSCAFGGLVEVAPLLAHSAPPLHCTSSTAPAALHLQSAFHTSFTALQSLRIYIT
jgi:hypothetical protein